MAVDLLGERPDPPKKKKAPGDPAVKRILDAFVTGFREKWNAEPNVAFAKDGALAKKMLATWGEETTTGLVARFFATTNPRVVRSNYTFGEFYALAQGLLIEDRRPADERTAGNVDAASRAMRRRGD